MAKFSCALYYKIRGRRYDTSDAYWRLLTYEDEHNLAYIKRTAGEDGENDGPYNSPR
jgi:hypothetical protein